MAVATLQVIVFLVKEFSGMNGLPVASQQYDYQHVVRRSPT